MSAKKKDNVELFMDHDIDLETSTLYLGSASYHESSENETGTDFHMAERAIKGLYLLDKKTTNGITIIMNNLGGDKYHGLAVYDAIQACNNHVKIIAMGYCMSMGAIIMQAADERVLSKNARMMIHYGTWSCGDHPKILYKWAEESKKYDALMRNIFIEKIKIANPSITLRKLDKMLDFDTIYNAKEAVAAGLADSIMSKMYK